MDYSVGVIEKRKGKEENHEKENYDSISTLRSCIKPDGMRYL